MYQQAGCHEQTPSDGAYLQRKVVWRNRPDDTVVIGAMTYIALQHSI